MQKKSSNKNDKIVHQKKHNTRYIKPFIISGFLFILDQTLKYLAKNAPDTTAYLIDPWIGWELFLNPGIAFGIPIPNKAIIIVTPILLLVLAKSLYKKQDSTWQLTGLMLIILGAISNYIDRLFFSITIDYVRIGTSIINIADVMIVVGAAILIFIDIFFTRKHNQGGICSQKSIPPLLSD